VNKLQLKIISIQWRRKKCTSKSQHWYHSDNFKISSKLHRKQNILET